jgi:hypothetical protein
MPPVLAPQSTVSADALLYLSWANSFSGTFHFASASTSPSVETSEDDEWDLAFEARASAIEAMGARALEDHANGRTKRISVRSR